MQTLYQNGYLSSSSLITSFLLRSLNSSLVELLLVLFPLELLFTFLLLMETSIDHLLVHSNFLSSSFLVSLVLLSYDLFSRTIIGFDDIIHVSNRFRGQVAWVRELARLLTRFLFLILEFQGGGTLLCFIQSLFIRLWSQRIGFGERIVERIKFFFFIILTL